MMLMSNRHNGHGPKTRAARLLALVLVLASLPVLAQQRRGQQGPPPDERASELADFIKANYTKYDFQIPVRDGARLFTSVYVPKDASPANLYPMLFDRTPYSVAPYGVDNYPRQIGPSEQLARSKYIFVYQDVRGAFMSEGEYVNMRPNDAAERGGKAVDESTDTYDTIDWLIKNVPYNNGKVGMWGISYPGFYTSTGMINAHPALKAASPQAPIADWFVGDDFHHNGALWLPHFFGFISVFGQARPEPRSTWPQPLNELAAIPEDGYAFYMGIEPLSLANEKYLKHRIAFWDEMIEHPNYDAYWQARNLLPHIQNIKPAVLTVGGWFDAEDLYGALNTYKTAARNSPAGPVRLLMGPWCHGCWARGDGESLGDIGFNAKTSEYYRQNIEYPFFEYYLKGKGEMNLATANVFETGTDQWRRYDAWPPKQAAEKTLYFGPNGTLSFTPSGEQGQPYDEYISDPSKPVPFFESITPGMARPYMDGDNREQGRRTDVLVYQTEPLAEDVTLAGPLKPSLLVSTSGTDSDFIVKLIDVYPANTADPQPNPKEVHLGLYEQLVRGEPMRGRFRNSYEKPEPFQPNQPTKIEFVMPDVNHTFRRGHRIMVQVQSTWFPLVDLNPQKFVPSIYEARAGDFQKATERVYRGKNGSRLNVWVVNPAAAAQ
jgi:putative CocE/NonD family hydrolase